MHFVVRAFKNLDALTQTIGWCVVTEIAEPAEFLCMQPSARYFACLGQIHRVAGADSNVEILMERSPNRIHVLGRPRLGLDLCQFVAAADVLASLCGLFLHA